MNASKRAEANRSAAGVCFSCGAGRMSVSGEMKITRTATATTVVNTICAGLATFIIIVREVYVFKRNRELPYDIRARLACFQTVEAEIRECSTLAVGGEDLKREADSS